jgi:hypothetical protein
MIWLSVLHQYECACFLYPSPFGALRGRDSQLLCLATFGCDAVNLTTALMEYG